MNFSKMIKSLNLLIFAMGLSLVQAGSHSEGPQLFIGKFPIPSKTKSPLNIDSSKAKKVALSPIRFDARIFEGTVVTNTGKSIQIVKNEDNLGATVTGGPLGDEIYIFHLTRVYLSGNTSGPSGTLIDGKNGVPIEGVHYWFNQKYGTFDNATLYRDGLAAFLFPVRVGPHPSITFVPFSQKLKKVRKPGSSAFAFLFEHFIWFDGYSQYNVPYFAYPGSYTDEKTSKTYYCTTNIVYRPQINYISYKQFEKYFLPLKDLEGKQLTNAVRSHPQGKIPVIKAVGQTQVFKVSIPFGNQQIDLFRFSY